MAINGTWRNTIGALFGTISTTAQAATKIVDAVSNSVDIVDDFVGSAKTKLKMENVLDLAKFEDEALCRLAVEDSDRKQKVRAYVDASATHKADFKESYARLYKVLHPQADAPDILADLVPNDQ